MSFKDIEKSLEEASINDFYVNPSMKAINKRKQQRNRYPPTLESLDTQNQKSFSSSTAGMNSIGNSRQNSIYTSNHSTPKGTNVLKPLPINDYHRVSDLMHRVTSVSGITPDQSQLSPINKPIPSSNIEIIANMPEYQLKAMKDSNNLRSTMEAVIELHHELETIITTHLMHRKEVTSKLEDVNNRYIKLFELTLSEMLKTQRTKFKSQTQDIEKLKAENTELQGQLAAVTHTSTLQSDKIILLHTNLLNISEQLTLSEEKLMEINEKNKELEIIINNNEINVNNNIKQIKKEYEEKITDIRSHYNHIITTEQCKYSTEKLKMIQNNEELKKELLFVQEEMKKLKKKLDAYDSSIQFNKNINGNKYPYKENSTQTVVNDECLWDKADGWILPISNTIKIRNLWRKGLNFAVCSSCRGIGQYIHQVGAILRNIHRKDEVLYETIQEDNMSKWCLPDVLVQFMCNLPKTIQACRIYTLPWTVRCVYYILLLKDKADQQDTELGYKKQSLLEFLIETYLRCSESRVQAEIKCYYLFKAIYEYYTKHALIQLFARLIGVLDTVSTLEYDHIQETRRKNKAAYKRKINNQIQNLGARERNKILQKEKIEKNEIRMNSEKECEITTRAIGSIDILSIILYARKCCLYAPYQGVYSIAIANAKSKSALQRAQSMKLRSVPENTFSIDSVLPDIYTPDYTRSSSDSSNSGSSSDCRVYLLDSPLPSSTSPLPSSTFTDIESTAAVRTPSSTVRTLSPHDPVPLHLCIGERSQHWLPMDRAVAVVKQLLWFLNSEEISAVYRTMEFNAMFLLENGTLDLPEGMHSLIRSTIRLFALCPVQGGWDLSWHDLYHSVADLGNQNEYSAHFIRTNANKELITPIPEPIIVPILGQSPSIKRAYLPTSDDENDSIEEKGLAEDKAEQSNEQLYIEQRLYYTKDPHLSYTDRRMQKDDYIAAASEGTGTDPPSGIPSGVSGGKKSWHESDSSSRPKTVTLESVLGNHAHTKHYRHIHPHTLLVNFDVTMQCIAEALLNRAESIGQRIRQIFVEGDTNHDGVLSFSEFLAIVQKVAPDFHERKILKMFREALMQGDDNECIGPDAFLSVCTSHGLIKILDVTSIAQNELRALSEPITVQSNNALHPARDADLLLRRSHHRHAYGSPTTAAAGTTATARSPKKPSQRMSSASTSTGSSAVLGKSTSKASAWKGSGAPTAMTAAPLPARKKSSEQSSTTMPTPSATRSRHRYEKLLQSLETERTMAQPAEEHEYNPELSQEHASPSMLASVSMPQLSTPPTVPLSTFHLAGIGGAVSVQLSKESVSQKQPIKGRASLQHAQSGGVSGAAATGADGQQTLTLSAEGLQGTSAGLSLRKYSSSYEQKPTSTTTTGAYASSSTGTVEMSDDVPGAPLMDSPKKQLKVMLPSVPSPTKLSGIQEWPRSTEETSDSETESPHCTDQHLVSPTQQTEEVVAPPQRHAISIDSAAIEAHLTQLKNIPLNEVQSKESSTRLLEQLKLKRAMRSSV